MNWNHSLLLATLVFLGVTSLYSFLSLFRRFLPTRTTTTALKLVRVVGTRTSPQDDNHDEVSQNRLASFDDFRRVRGNNAKVTLAKKLRHAAWSISPLTFYALCAASAVALLMLFAPYVDVFVLPFVIFAGPFSIRWFLNECVERRCDRFADDYPQFLMTVVGLLKTGMTPAGALDAAARGLEQTSLVRREVTLMLERVKVGVPEEKSIGALGETIAHPEIELFVQSLLLSIRVGGSLADSLERLSKQVRKRQYFKRSAVASIAQQRGSMLAILVIMGGLSVFITFLMPKLFLGMYSHPTGWKIIQASAVALMVAVLWLRAISRIKI